MTRVLLVDDEPLVLIGMQGMLNWAALGYEVVGTARNGAEALRAVHTLKGICQNLSFTRLFESSNLVTNALKENDCNKAVEMMPKLSEDYYQTVHAIEMYKKSREE